MILRGKFSPRRKALLALVLIVLAWLGYAWYANIAITQGIEQKDMDWNGDGTVTRDEIIESFYAVAVNDSQDGNRHCRTFVWRSTGEQIRGRQGVHRYHATKGLAAIQHGRRAAQYFHPTDHADIKIVATAVGIGTDKKTIGNRNLIDQGQHTIAADAADAKAAGTETAVAGIDADTGFLADQIGQVDDLPLLNLFFADQRYRAGNIGDGTWMARADDNDRRQFGGFRFLIRFSIVLLRVTGKAESQKYSRQDRQKHA